MSNCCRSWKTPTIRSDDIFRWKTVSTPSWILLHFTWSIDGTVQNAKVHQMLILVFSEKARTKARYHANMHQIRQSLTLNFSMIRWRLTKWLKACGFSWRMEKNWKLYFEHFSTPRRLKIWAVLYATTAFVRKILDKDPVQYGCETCVLLVKNKSKF
jgi:hypothetical protein